MVDEAQRTGQALTSAAINNVPGAKVLLRAMAHQAQQTQEIAAEAAKVVPVGKAMQEMQQFLGENKKIVELTADMVAHAQKVQDQLADTLLDADLICGGDLKRLQHAMNSLGFEEVIHPPRRYNIQLGSTPLTSGYPAAMQGPLPLLAANGGLLKHHRITFDYTVSLPAHRLFGETGIFKLPVTLGFQVATNFVDSIGVYFVHNISPSLTADGSKDFVETKLSELLGHTGATVGFQYNGRTPTSCPPLSENYSFGIPVKLTDWLGIGFRTYCPVWWGGFGVAIPKPQYGHDVAETFRILSGVKSPSGGTTPVPGVDAGSTPDKRLRVGWPEVRSVGAGYEGSLEIRATDNAGGGNY